MIGSESKALLPIGFCDLLPPAADLEAKVVEAVMSVFFAYGYERVKPPLIEFEESLFAVGDSGILAQTFRVMDPHSQRMMGVRADTTIQVARIAATRLASEPRPLRLCYSGQVLRVKGSELRPSRQFTQTGLELVGADSPLADAEVVLAACSALKAVGVEKVMVDLNLPTVVPSVIADLGLDDAAKRRLVKALDRKDMADVNDELAEFGAEGQAVKNLLEGLVRASGSVEKSLPKAKGLNLPPNAAKEIVRLSEVVELLQKADKSLDLTIDLVENRGFEYHTGISFSVFAPNARGELGRGGRYLTADIAARNKNKKTIRKPETATGVTLFIDAVTNILPFPERAEKVFVPFSESFEVAEKLRKEGRVVISGLAPAKDEKAEAKLMGCALIYIGGQISSI